MPPKRLRAVRRKPIAVPREVTATNEAPVLVEPEPKLMKAPVPFVWTMERTLALFNSMIGRKPAGINKHLNMLLIKMHLSKRLKMDVPINEIWRFMYAHWDMALADKIESLSIDIKPRDFELPDTEEWAQLIREESEKCEEMEKEKDVKMQPSQTATSSVRDLIILKEVKVMVVRMDGGSGIDNDLLNSFKSNKSSNHGTTSENGLNDVETESTSSNVNIGVNKKRANNISCNGSVVVKKPKN